MAMCRDTHTQHVHTLTLTHAPHSARMHHTLHASHTARTTHCTHTTTRTRARTHTYTRARTTACTMHCTHAPTCTTCTHYTLHAPHTARTHAPDTTRTHQTLHARMHTYTRARTTHCTHHALHARTHMHHRLCTLTSRSRSRFFLFVRRRTFLHRRWFNSPEPNDCPVRLPRCRIISGRWRSISKFTKAKLTFFSATMCECERTGIDVGSKEEG